MEKAYNLSVKELLILLSLKGAGHIFGLFDNTDAAPDKRTINQILFKMKNRGILIPGEKEDKFSVEEGLDDILNMIIASEGVMVFKSNDETVPDQCIYTGDGQVYYRYLPGNERIHIRKIQSGLIWDTISDTGWGSISGMYHKDKEKTIVSDPPYVGEFTDGISTVMEIKGISAFAYLLRTDNGVCEKQLIVYDKDIRELIIMRDKDESTAYEYSEEVLKECLEEMK